MDLILRPGISSVAAIGAAPNANGATVAGTVLTLQPASASFGGLITAAAQTIAGAKTFLSLILSQPAGTAGISLDPNAATGAFALALSPANLTAARRWSFPDRSDTVAGLGAQTFTGAQTMTDATDSTSTTTGALAVAGGVGIAKKLYVGQFAQFSSDVTIDKTGAALQFNVKADDASQAEFKFANRSGQGLSIFRPGGSTNLEFYAQASSTVFSLTNAALASGQASVLYTTDATTATAGALAVAGGIAVAKRLCLDGATGKTIKYVNGTANGAVAVLFGAVGPTGSTAGNAQGWIRIDVAGTDRFIPYW